MKTVLLAALALSAQSLLGDPTPITSPSPTKAPARPVDPLTKLLADQGVANTPSFSIQKSGWMTSIRIQIFDKLKITPDYLANLVADQALKEDPTRDVEITVQVYELAIFQQNGKADGVYHETHKATASRMRAHPAAASR